MALCNYNSKHKLKNQQIRTYHFYDAISSPSLFAPTGDQPRVIAQLIAISEVVIVTKSLGATNRQDIFSSMPTTSPIAWRKETVYEVMICRWSKQR